MPISNVNNNAYAAYTKAAEPVTSKKVAQAKENEQASNTAKETELDEVTFEKSEAPAAKPTYEKTTKLTKEQVSRLETMREESLRNMVTQLLSMQAMGGKKTQVSLPDISDLLGATQTAPAVEAAAESEDFYGVNAVATRIMDMAISLSGGDTSKIETLKNAVIKGFEEAGAAFGAKLPDVCDKTYDEIMKRFDYWEKNGSLDGYAYKAEDEE